MKSTSDTVKSIKATSHAKQFVGQRQVRYMIDNQYRAIRLILEEQNEMFSNKRSGTDQNDISEFFDSQVDANSEVIRYLFEVRDCLTEAIETPADLPNILSRLEEEACKGANEWILDLFSDVIECMEQLRVPSVIHHSNSVEAGAKNVLKAA